MIAEFLGPVKMLRAFGKLGSLLLQMSPAFSPKEHTPGGTENAASVRCRVTASRSNCGTGIGRKASILPATLRFFREHAGSRSSRWMRRRRIISRSCRRDLDEITNPGVAYLRLHGRDAKAYITGKTVAARFNYDYSDEEIAEVAERSKKLAKGAKEVHVRL